MKKDEAADIKFCENLLRKYRAIKNRIVVLCEGDRNYLKVKTPQQYRRLSEYQDAAFWKETIPSWWREKKPVFIPCGGRNQVSNIRKILLDLHYEDESNSYLCPDKLFILIDLDLQPAIIDRDTGYSTEKLYYDLYHNDLIDIEVLNKYKTIVTGFIHKEAYFFEPNLQVVFDDSQYEINYNNKQLSLIDLYQDMLLKIDTDEDLNNNFYLVIARIKNMLSILPSDRQELNHKLSQLFNDSSLSSENKRKVIKAILTIVKSKPFWQEKIKIKSNENLSQEYALTNQEYQDNLMRNIAEFYARKCQYSSIKPSKYHICQWVNYLFNASKN